MKKALVAALSLGIFAWAGSAVAGPLSYYESYEGYQSVKEGQSYYFYFDLVLAGNEYTNSALTLTNDAASGFGVLPFDSAYIEIDLYSADWAKEKVNINLTAYYDNSDYTIFDGWFNAYWPGSTINSFYYDLSGTSFVKDPFGDVQITASVTPWWNYNDFGIKKVAIGGTATAPVPEPATMLLFGAGLAGLAAVGRRRKAE